MNKYESIIFWSNEDQELIAEGPESLGCATNWVNYQHPLVDVAVVIQEWIEPAMELSRRFPKLKDRLVFA